MILGTLDIGLWKWNATLCFDECFDAKPLLPLVSVLEPDTHTRVAKALITQII